MDYTIFRIDWLALGKDFIRSGIGVSHITADTDKDAVKMFSVRFGEAEPYRDCVLARGDLSDIRNLVPEIIVKRVASICDVHFGTASEAVARRALGDRK